ncbi:MAG: HAD-IIIC family phosphatase [Bacteroidia bacterium]
MYSMLSLSDVVLDLVAKEVQSFTNNNVSIKSVYSGDLVLKLMSLTKEEIRQHDIIFIHSDQLFHQRDQQWQKNFCHAVEELSRKFNKTILLSNAFSQSYSAMPVKHSFGYNNDTANVYKNEFKGLLEQSNVFVFDFCDMLMQAGIDSFYNYNLGHLYQMPYTQKGIKLLAQRLAGQVLWLFTEEKKVIVLDCDNTLWKGIVGEDGIEGIVCDKNSAGILYYNLQLFLKAKKEEGFLLCLCSRNNEPDVKAAFDRNLFPLKWNDFIVKKINWADKIDNINSIAKELNLSPGSFIFIDDNPFELNSVSELIKGVECIHLDGNYNEFLLLTRRLSFRRKQVLQADREKTRHYETEQLREKEKTQFSDMEEFIKNLGIKLDVRLNDMDDLARLSQLTEKTNQFNFNKHPYTVDGLKSFIQHKNRIYSLKVSDKYGDYGTVGMMLIKINGHEYIIENYLLSCRVLGKGIEKEFYATVTGKLAKEKIALKEITFLKNEKNQPACDFFKQLNHRNQ